MDDHHKNNFLEIYDKYAEPVFRHCCIRTADREKAKDIVQDVFLKTWKYLEQGKKIENPKAFVYRVANNLIIDDYRKKRPDSLDELRAMGFEPVGASVQSVELAAETRVALELVARLDPAYRDILLMRFVDDLSISEIAAVMEMSENAVSVRIHRGIEKLKELL